MKSSRMNATKLNDPRAAQSALFEEKLETTARK